VKTIATALILGSSFACATVGKNFDATGLSWLKDGETTKAQVLEKLGPPWRVGSDAGYLTWTYGYYEYRAFSDSNSKDLVLHFLADGKLKSYTLNTSFPEEREKLDPSLATRAPGG
jgi:outer membrane protein assembly factor BamE (lipoprotein component of BamABCDE complex)